MARYDGLAQWYDREFDPSPLESTTWEVLRRLLGPGDGSLLDVGCGTGSYSAALAELGWEVTGVDVSEDMLERARAKGVHAVRADACSLPFDDSSFDAAVSLWTHTDVDDFAAALREVVRVLRGGGPFVYVGVHPCFVGPHSEYVEAQGVPKLHASWYRRSGPYAEAPGRSGKGLRARVGESFHRPLDEFLQTFLDAGLRLEKIEEPEERDYPYMLALRWRRGPNATGGA
jgi:ubiquinone/menaquinone biosynthesis C-methylase UbiE